MGIYSPTSIYSGANNRDGRDFSPSREVECGLQNERPRISAALKNADYYRGDNARYVPIRDAESPYDYQFRPKYTLLLVRQVIEILSDHVYSAAPVRQIANDKRANDLYGQIARDCHLDSVMGEADRLANLSDCSAIQVFATGDPRHPLRMHLFGAEEFACWWNDDDPLTPTAVCTISRYNGVSNFTLWYVDKIEHWVSDEWTPTKTAGGRTARLVKSESNPYGCIPFGFVHAQIPVREFWTSGIGTPMREANQRIDQKLSELAEAVQYYSKPIPVASNVDDTWQPVIRPGSVVKLPPASLNYPEGGNTPPAPRLEYLAPVLDIQSLWYDIEQSILTQLESVGVPRSAVRLEQGMATSGIQIIAEQAPLLAKARTRRVAMARFEASLATVAMQVYGAYYDDAAMLFVSKDLDFVCAWPEARIPIPGPDRDQADEFEISHGMKSRVMVVQERYGLTRDQAIERIRQVAEDERDLASISPSVSVLGEPGDDDGGEPPTLPKKGAMGNDSSGEATEDDDDQGYGGDAYADSGV